MTDASTREREGGDAAARDVDLDRAVRYSRTRELLAVVGILWGLLAEALFFFSGGSARLRRLARHDLFYALGIGLLSRLAGLPLGYVRGYWLEHRYGLSNQDHRAWAVDQAKATGLGLALETPILLVSYAVIRRSPRRWWLILSGLALPFTVVLAQLYPVLIAPIFNKFTPLADADLAARIKGLAGRAGVRVADVVQMDMSRQTRKANAFFAGLGATKRIALGDTLVGEFTPDEVEVVVAHELGHQVHRDIWKAVALGTGFTLAGAWLVARFAPSLAARTARRTGVSRIDDVASAPLLGLLLGLFSAAAMPLANTVSRELVEKPADRYALGLTGKPDAFVSAMERLGRQNLSDPNPPRLVKLLLHSHPTVAERVAMARRMYTP